MEKRHEGTIISRLEDVFLNGCSHITDKELSHWYAVQRKGIELYRDLERKWQEISNGEKGELMKVNGRGGIYLFAEKDIEQLDVSNAKSLSKYE